MSRRQQDLQERENLAPRRLGENGRDINKTKEGIEEKRRKRARRSVAQQRPELGVDLSLP